MNKFNYKTRDKRLKEIIIGQTVVCLVILISSLVLIFWGFGYKIDWQNLTIKHTGIIYLTFQPKDAEVSINGSIAQKSSPFYLTTLPGYYETEVRKDGYSSWYENILVEADKVFSCKNIVLFKSKPEIQDVTDSGTISQIDAPYDTLIKNPQGDLVANDYEIWDGDKLVTRFSEKISGVIWYPGNAYIAFQQGDEIRIIGKNGINDIALVKLSNNTPTKFLFSWDGSSLLYRDGSIYKKAKIN